VSIISREGQFGPVPNAATPPDIAVSAALRRACSSDPVDPSASLTLLGHHIEPELLLQGSSDGAAHRVSLPPEGGDDFIDPGAHGA
jgi:hypothetical protein